MPHRRKTIREPSLRIIWDDEKKNEHHPLEEQHRQQQLMSQPIQMAPQGFFGDPNISTHPPTILFHPINHNLPTNFHQKSPNLREVPNNDSVFIPFNPNLPPNNPQQNILFPYLLMPNTPDFHHPGQIFPHTGIPHLNTTEEKVNESHQHTPQLKTYQEYPSKTTETNIHQSNVSQITPNEKFNTRYGQTFYDKNVRNSDDKSEDDIIVISNNPYEGIIWNNTTRSFDDYQPPKLVPNTYDTKCSVEETENILEVKNFKQSILPSTNSNIIPDFVLKVDPKTDPISSSSDSLSYNTKQYQNRTTENMFLPPQVVNPFSRQTPLNYLGRNRTVLGPRFNKDRITDKENTVPGGDERLKIEDWPHLSPKNYSRNEILKNLDNNTYVDQTQVVSTAPAFIQQANRFNFQFCNAVPRSNISLNQDHIENQSQARNVDIDFQKNQLDKYPNIQDSSANTYEIPKVTTTQFETNECSFQQKGETSIKVGKQLTKGRIKKPELSPKDIADIKGIYRTNSNNFSQFKSKETPELNRRDMSLGYSIHNKSMSWTRNAIIEKTDEKLAYVNCDKSLNSNIEQTKQLCTNQDETANNKKKNNKGDAKIYHSTVCENSQLKVPFGTVNTSKSLKQNLNGNENKQSSSTLILNKHNLSLDNQNVSKQGNPTDNVANLPSIPGYAATGNIKNDNLNPTCSKEATTNENLNIEDQERHSLENKANRENQKNEMRTKISENPTTRIRKCDENVFNGTGKNVGKNKSRSIGCTNSEMNVSPGPAPPKTIGKRPVRQPGVSRNKLQRCTVRFNSACEWIGDLALMEKHIYVAHPSLLFTTNKQKLSIFEFCKKPQIKYYATFNVFKNLFRFSYEIDAANGKVNFGTYFLRPMRNSADYCFEVVFLKASIKSVKLKAPCFYMSDDEETFLKDSYISVSYDMVQSCVDDCGDLSFIVKIYKI